MTLSVIRFFGGLPQYVILVRFLLLYPLALLLMTHPVLTWSQTISSGASCRPEQHGQARLVELRPDFFTVQGQLAGFDPCNPHVKFRLPDGVNLPPLMISVHGGGGVKDVLGSDAEFYRQGFATLAFDAYEMNGFSGRSSLFWARQVTNESRQRMLLTTAWAAVQWAMARADIDTRRIYLFGISNGAAVVANLAAMVDPTHVKGIIAEGITPIGLGLPADIRVPLMLAFGKLDNFGSPRAEVMRWMLTGSCRLNIRFVLSPPGTSENCSGDSLPGHNTPTPLEWAGSLQGKSQPIEMAFFDEMAHNAFFGPLSLQTARWGNGEVLHSSLGANDAARKQFMRAMMDFLRRHGLGRTD